MNSTIKFSSLPDTQKPACAKSLLAGLGWYFFGDLVEHPGADTLRKWAGLAPQTPQVGVVGAGSIGTAEGGILREIRTRTREGLNSDIAHPRTREGNMDFATFPRTREGKRLAVDQALSSNVNLSDRELSRRLGVSHRFVALRRRKAGDVAGVDVNKC